MLPYYNLVSGYGKVNLYRAESMLRLNVTLKVGAHKTALVLWVNCDTGERLIVVVGPWSTKPSVPGPDQGAKQIVGQAMVGLGGKFTAKTRTLGQEERLYHRCETADGSKHVRPRATNNDGRPKKGGRFYIVTKDSLGGEGV